MNIIRVRFGKKEGKKGLPKLESFRKGKINLN